MIRRGIFAFRPIKTFAWVRALIGQTGSPTGGSGGSGGGGSTQNELDYSQQVNSGYYILTNSFGLSV